MFKLLILSLAFASGFCTPPFKRANVTTPFVPKIIQGEDANEGQFPYMVSLNWVGDGHACGASILTSKWVLTAAHCCLTGIDMYVFAGTIFISGPGESYDIAEYIIHGDYDPDNGWRNDICLIQLRDELRFSDRIQQVTLPPQDWPVNDGDSLLISGWGYTNPNPDEQVIPDRMQVGYNFIGLSNDHCGQITGVNMYDGYLCCQGNHQGQGVCNGDSGSPLMKDGVQVGITSWVFLPCGSGLPDFYTRVPYHINWIQQVLGKDAVNLKFRN